MGAGGGGWGGSAIGAWGNWWASIHDQWIEVGMCIYGFWEVMGMRLRQVTLVTHVRILLRPATVNFNLFSTNVVHRPI